MLKGPIGSPYPGKYVMFAFAAFFAMLTWRFSRSALRAKKEERDRGASGIILKPNPRKSFGNAATATIIALFLLVTALASIYIEWSK
jgi:hypothetical protein